jgi:hypothetical protein
MGIKIDPYAVAKKYGGVEIPKPAAPPPPKKVTPQPVAPAPPPPPAMPKLPTLRKTAIDRLLLDRTGVDKQFEVNRQKAASQETAQVQGQRDALARRAAALGGGPGGAFVKAEQNAMNESAQRLGAANMEIDAAKDAEMRRIGELETQLNVQREEAQAGRDLQTWQTEFAGALQKYGMDEEAARWGQNFAFEQDKFKTTTDLAKEENKINAASAVLTNYQNLLSVMTPAEAEGLLQDLGLDGLGINMKDFGPRKHRPPIVQPTSGGFGARAKAFKENRANGYTTEELQAAGFTEWS